MRERFATSVLHRGAASGGQRDTVIYDPASGTEMLELYNNLLRSFHLVETEKQVTHTKETTDFAIKVRIPLTTKSP